MQILIDMPPFTPLLKELERIPGVRYRLTNQPEERVRPLPLDQIRDCDVLFCTFPPENHEEMTNLKFIQISSAGYGQLAGKGFVKRGIRAANALGVSDVPIAEWNIAMMINLARDFKGMIRNQEQRFWDRSPRFQKEIRNSVVGIWGYGGIGRETARLAKGLGMNVHILTQRPVTVRNGVYNVPGTGDPDGTLPDKMFLYNQKEEFLSNLDFLVMAIPQKEPTVGIVGEKELRLLGTTAFLLNPARGPLVREDALVKALEEGWIAGAALDTHYYYPLPPDHVLWGFPNVILTPHISGSSSNPRFLERIFDIFIKNVKSLIFDGSLLNELSRDQLNGD